MTTVVVRKTQRSQVRTAFLFTIGFMTIWCVGTILEMDTRIVTGATNMIFINLCYIGICVTPVAILFLGKAILHSNWKPGLVHAAFLVIPLASIIVIFTNPLHNWFFVNFSLDSTEAVYGAYYYFHSIYSYGCIFVGIVFLLVASSRSSGLFSMQSLLIVFGVMITLVPNVLYSLGLANLPFNISMAAFTMTILCFLIAFKKYRFITALPITLRDVVDLISDGYLVVDQQLHILAYNKAMIRMFPENTTIAVGSSLKTLVDNYFVSTTYELFLHLNTMAAEKKGTVTEDANIYGNTHVSVEFTPVIQRNAQIGSIIMLKDITQSRLLIEATRAASRAKGDFLTNMSHEIRTPMNAIIGMVAIGKTTNDPDRKDYCLSKISDASTHLLGVINDILDMSKIEAGKLELSPVEYDFERMIQRVVNIVNFRVESKKQTFEVKLDSNIPEVLIGDDQRIAQVIANLLGNAVKFTPERGSIALEAKFLEEADGVCTIQVDVADSGIGISPEQQSKLFQAFTQAEAGTVRKFGGTGLGLSISKSIVEMMDGRIWVEAEIGKGSVFSFTYKAERGETKEEKRKKLSSWGDIRILVVDDNQDILAYFKEVLHHFGIPCDTAESGEEALQLVARNGSYDIYFLDWQMPGIDGIELTKELKAKASTGGATHVVIFSAVDWSQIQVEAKLAGADDFMAKPLFPSSISDIINKFVGLEVTKNDDIKEDINGVLEGHRILLAEDVDINREIMVTLLEPTLLQIDCAVNGAEAVRMFSEAPGKYELICMDIQMPEMDGYKATAAIRELDSPEAKNVPIIALTANVFREDIDRCLEAGMNDHLGKPLNFDEVLKKLRAYLLGRAPGQS